MSDTDTTAPFGHPRLLDVAYGRVWERMRDKIMAILADRPDGVVMAANPLILPEPKYFGQGDPERLIKALELFRDEVVFWATPIGQPEEKYFTTALSKLYLSWLFGCPSNTVNPLALPFGVTRYGGGVCITDGVAITPGPDRLAIAYSGAREEQDHDIATWVGMEAFTLADNGYADIQDLEDPKVNFITPETLERIEPLRDVGIIPSCLEQVRAAPVMLAA